MVHSGAKQNALVWILKVSPKASHAKGVVSSLKLD